MDVMEWLKQGSEIRKALNSIKSDNWYQKYHFLLVHEIFEDFRGIRLIKKYATSSNSKKKERAYALLLLHSLFGNKRSIKLLLRYLGKKRGSQKIDPASINGAMQMLSSESIDAFFYLLSFGPNSKMHIEDVLSCQLTPGVERKALECKEKIGKQERKKIYLLELQERRQYIISRCFFMWSHMATSDEFSEELREKVDEYLSDEINVFLFEGKKNCECLDELSHSLHGSLDWDGGSRRLKALYDVAHIGAPNEFPVIIV